MAVDEQHTFPVFSSELQRSLNMLQSCCQAATRLALNIVKREYKLFNLRRGVDADWIRVTDIFYGYDPIEHGSGCARFRHRTNEDIFCLWIRAIKQRHLLPHLAKTQNLRLLMNKDECFRCLSQCGPIIISKNVAEFTFNN